LSFQASKALEKMKSGLKNRGVQSVLCQILKPHARTLCRSEHFLRDILGIGHSDTFAIGMCPNHKARLSLATPYHWTSVRSSKGRAASAGELNAS
jgi:hypothetical protein